MHPPLQNIDDCRAERDAVLRHVMRRQNVLDRRDRVLAKLRAFMQGLLAFTPDQPTQGLLNDAHRYGVSVKPHLLTDLGAVRGYFDEMNRKLAPVIRAVKAAQPQESKHLQELYNDFFEEYEIQFCDKKASAEDMMAGYVAL